MWVVSGGRVAGNGWVAWRPLLAASRQANINSSRKRKCACWTAMRAQLAKMPPPFHHTSTHPTSPPPSTHTHTASPLTTTRRRCSSSRPLFWLLPMPSRSCEERKRGQGSLSLPATTRAAHTHAPTHTCTHARTHTHSHTKHATHPKLPPAAPSSAHLRQPVVQRQGAGADVHGVEVHLEDAAAGHHGGGQQLAGPAAGRGRAGGLEGTGGYVGAAPVGGWGKGAVARSGGKWAVCLGGWAAELEGRCRQNRSRNSGSTRACGHAAAGPAGSPARQARCTKTTHHCCVHSSTSNTPAPRTTTHWSACLNSAAAMAWPHATPLSQSAEMMWECCSEEGVCPASTIESYTTAAWQPGEDVQEGWVGV